MGKNRFFEFFQVSRPTISRARGDVQSDLSFFSIYICSAVSHNDLSNFHGCPFGFVGKIEPFLRILGVSPAQLN